MDKLKKIAEPPEGPVVVVILDGVGIGRGDEGDAVQQARTPALDRILEESPHTTIKAHGTAVGLPSDKDMGNSEVGHNALGAGRVFDQGAKLVNKAIETGVLFEGKAWKAAIERCAAGGTLHLIGLLSDGNVHSHIDQVFALIRRARQDGVKRLRVHPLLDGRDVPETSALEYIDALEDLLGSLAGGGEADYRIASGGGRMKVTMDRYEADWSVVETGWKAHVLGEGRRFASAREAIETYRQEDPSVIDQFLPAFVVADDNGPVGTIEDGDAVVFFNYRGDRALEISRAFEEGESFDKFDRERVPDVFYAGMMEYDGDLHIPSSFLVEPPQSQRTIGTYLSLTGLTQLACAETQKYGHVTYFWNGNNTGIYDPEKGKFIDVKGERRSGATYEVVERSAGLETYLEVPSDRVPFEQRPWMKAAEVTDAVLDGLAARSYDVVRINYANGDMVGHTGDLRAAIMAVEAVDLCLGRLLAEVKRRKGVALVTADHGNSDQMFEFDKKSGGYQLDDQGRPRRRTSHTLNPVRFIVFDPHGEGRFTIDDTVESPGLANVAATILTILGREVPEEFKPSLVRRG